MMILIEVSRTGPLPFSKNHISQFSARHRSASGTTRTTVSLPVRQARPSRLPGPPLCAPSSSSWRRTTAGLPTWGTVALLGTRMGVSTSRAGQASSKATRRPAPSSPRLGPGSRHPILICTLDRCHCSAYSTFELCVKLDCDFKSLSGLNNRGTASANTE
eukprot:3841437-Rhodomonas_salina.1